ncbi:28S ribosomal protein S35, mitochondrial [Tyrophagus putrescentiae]|nr:28S ribosomal protein S35, mitochondrial [Tyrophagus putrescentiae]
MNYRGGLSLYCRLQQLMLWQRSSAAAAAAANSSTTMSSSASIFSRHLSSTSSSPSPNLDLDLFEKRESEDFPVLNILPYSRTRREARTFYKPDMISPRYKRMAVNQDWASAWPAARTFHPASVPLPLHMSYVDDLKMNSPLPKFNNPELLKIPKLPPLDATGPLKSDEDLDRHFPVSITTKDFVFSGASLRWPDARIVELKIKLADLKLDDHASDKMKRLLRHRYDPQTDLITLRTDSCPLRAQNLEYGQYLLTALYFESWKTEPWEAEKAYSDWERYFWEKSPSKRRPTRKPFPNEKAILGSEPVQRYARAVEDMVNRAQSAPVLGAYKESVLKLLF